MLWCYNLSRRKFFKIIGLSAAGMALSGGQLSAQSSSAGKSTGTGAETIPLNQLVARAITDAGAGVVTSAPATGTAKIFDAYNAMRSPTAPYSFNEEVAYTVAHGAGLAGIRSAAIIKSHGFAKASNSVVDSQTAGTGISSMFAFGPYACIDVCTYYGGSLPLAIGAYLSGKRRAWAVTGDYAFIAAGHMGLIEAAGRKVPLKVMVLHNGQPLTTGGQPIADGVLDHLLNGYADHVRPVRSPGHSDSIRPVLLSAAESGQLEIVVADDTSSSLTSLR